MIRGYYDIHSHVLPGIDDGAKDMDMTMEMIAEAYRQGVRTMIATPHYYPGHKNKPKEYIWQVYRETAAKIQEKYSDFSLFLGNEIYYKSEILERLQSKEIFTMADTNYILLEFSVVAEYQYIYNAVKRCVDKGYYPILAHIERYRCLFKEEERIAELIKAGAYMQVNAENFRKGFMVAGRSSCMKLFHNNMVHFLGSDCHNTDTRSPNLGPALQYLKAKVEHEIRSRVVHQYPEKLFENKFI